MNDHRTADAVLTLLDKSGNPIPRKTVEVAQKQHKFLFGNTGFEIIPLAAGQLSGPEKERAELIFKRLTDLYNFITLPFYWGRFEPERGKPDTDRILKTAKLFKQAGCVLKGHPLCWHTVCADWLLPLSTEEILETQIKRIHRDVSGFAGVIDMWDVLNEVVIMPIFDKYDNGVTRIAKKLGRIPIVRTMFDAARSSNPGATLLLNDFETSIAYEILLEGCLEAGIKIDTIGIQSHMHQGYWGMEKTLRILERYEHFGLPIHFTEITMVSGELMPAHIVDLNDHQVTEWPTTPEGEDRQASELMEFYETLMAHPLVEGITYWGLTDGGWLNAPGGLLRADLSRKPVYDALLERVKGDWWLSPTQMTTDDAGRLTFNGFLGDYQVSCPECGKSVDFQLAEKGEASLNIAL